MRGLKELFAIAIHHADGREEILSIDTPLGPVPIIAETLDDLRRVFSLADATYKMPVTWYAVRFDYAGRVPKLEITVHPKAPPSGSTIGGVA